LFRTKKEKTRAQLSNHKHYNCTGKVLQRVIFAETVGSLSQWTLTFNIELPWNELQKKIVDCV